MTTWDITHRTIVGIGSVVKVLHAVLGRCCLAVIQLHYRVLCVVNRQLGEIVLYACQCRGLNYVTASPYTRHARASPSLNISCTIGSDTSHAHVHQCKQSRTRACDVDARKTQQAHCRTSSHRIGE